MFFFMLLGTNQPPIIFYQGIAPCLVGPHYGYITYIPWHTMATSPSSVATSSQICASPSEGLWAVHLQTYGQSFSFGHWNHMAMEKTFFFQMIFPMKTSIYRGFPIATFDYWRVTVQFIVMFQQLPYVSIGSISGLYPFSDTHTVKHYTYIYTHMRHGQTMVCGIQSPIQHLIYHIYKMVCQPLAICYRFAMDETTINKQWWYNWIMKVDWSLVGPDAF